MVVRFVSYAVVSAVVAVTALACSSGGANSYAVTSTIVDRACGGDLVSPVFAGSGPPGNLHGNDDPIWTAVRWRGSPPATERSGKWEGRSGTLTIRDTSPVSATFTTDSGKALEMTKAPVLDLC